MLVFGAKFFVTQAVTIATIMGVNESVIGLTIVAAGTSLPELAASVSRQPFAGRRTWQSETITRGASHSLKAFTVSLAEYSRKFIHPADAILAGNTMRTRAARASRLPCHTRA